MDLRIGDTIRLRLQLDTSDFGKFPVAYVRDALDAPLAGSPVSLVHLSHAQYGNDSLVMPNSDAVFVTYEVFEDALHTIPSAYTLKMEAIERLQQDLPCSESVIVATLKTSKVNVSVFESRLELTVGSDGVRVTAESSSVDAVAAASKVKTKVESSNLLAKIERTDLCLEEQPRGNL